MSVDRAHIAKCFGDDHEGIRSDRTSCGCSCHPDPETCGKCDFGIAWRNGGWVHVAPKEVIEEALSPNDIERRVNAFLHITRDHAAEPNRGA